MGSLRQIKLIAVRILLGYLRCDLRFTCWTKIAYVACPAFCILIPVVVLRLPPAAFCFVAFLRARVAWDFTFDSARLAGPVSWSFAANRLCIAMRSGKRRTGFVNWRGRAFRMRCELCRACMLRMKRVSSVCLITIWVHSVSCLSWRTGTLSNWQFVVWQSCWALNEKRMLWEFWK